MLTDRNWFLLAVFLYGSSLIYSVLLWRKGFRHDDRVNYIILAAAFILHTVALVKRGFSLNRCPIQNLYEATTFISWAMVAAYMVIGIVPRLRFIGAFASPLLFGMGVFALMPDLDRHRGDLPNFTGAWPSLHAATILLSYGSFGMAAVASLMYITQEHDLKFRKLRAVLSFMPSIQRLETVINYCVVIGFVLLTVGLGVGAYWLKTTSGVVFKPDPKILWSLVVWLIYAGILFARCKMEIRGRRYAWFILVSFAFVLLTFWGFNLISGIHNP